ncbi:MAG TPA: hypothetical protein VF545_03870 [Thermoleophilaceae bacterium]|jgi:hypothetical protein
MPATAAAKKASETPEAIHATRWWLLVGLAVLVLPSVALSRFAGGWMKHIVVGDDNALSTSKTIASVWTYLIAAVLLGFVLAKFFGHAQAFNKIRHQGLEGQYALLFGGPLGAAILAKGVVTSQVREGKTTKAPVAKPKLRHLLTDNEEKADPGDLQYVLFNFVAMVYFVGTVVHVPLAGFPHIPNVLMGLTSVAAVGYVGKKTIPSFGGEPHTEHVAQRQQQQGAPGQRGHR